MASVNDRLTALIESNFAIPRDRLTPATTLADIGLTESLDHADFGFFLEREFSITIDWDETPWANIRTLGELEFEIEKKIALDARARAAA